MPAPSVIDINTNSPAAGTTDFTAAQYATYPTSVVPPEEEGLSGEGLLSLAPNRYAQTPYTDEKDEPWVPDAPSRGKSRHQSAYREFDFSL